MPYLEREAYMERLKNLIGEDNTEEALSTLEDMTDTYDELTRRNGESDQLRAELERANERYRKRFFEGPTNPTGDNADVFIEDTAAETAEPEEVAEELTYDKLFEEEK